MQFHCFYRLISKFPFPEELHGDCESCGVLDSSIVTADAFDERYLVARVVEELQPLGGVVTEAEQVEQLLVVDLQQRDFDRELGAVL